MEQGEQRKRPLGVTLLAAAFLVGGAALAVLQVQHRDVVATVGAATFVATALLAGLGLASGAGLWLGRPWGWWLAAFSLTYAVLRYANTLAAVPMLAAQLDMAQEEVRTAYLRYGARLVGQGLLLLYLFRPGVAAFFGVEGMAGRRRLGLLLVAAAALLLAMASLSRALGGG
jgi:hypothetical protein